MPWHHAQTLNPTGSTTRTATLLVQGSLTFQIVGLSLPAKLGTRPATPRTQRKGAMAAVGWNG